MIIEEKYEMIEKIGEGGMGAVYRVRHKAFNELSALKILQGAAAQAEEAVRRFEREARVMKRLRHGNIVQVYDYGRDGERYYIEMELIEGIDLAQTLRREGPFPLQRVLEIGCDVASALAYAHAQSPVVIHRDIKPHNIMLDARTGRAIVTDFGIAKLMGEHEAMPMTRAGFFVGTPIYSAPEQLAGNPDLDPRVDVYALGLVLHELCTGKHLFSGMSSEQFRARVFGVEDNLPDFPPECPEQFQQLVVRALAKDRDRRHASGDELLTDLRHVLTLSGETQTDTSRWRQTLRSADDHVDQDSDMQLDVANARRRALEARETTRADPVIRRHATAQLESADSEWMAGESARAAGDLPAALEHYVEVARACRHAQRQGRQGAERADAESARARVESVRSGAERYDAEKLAPEAYAEAQASEGRAEGAFAAERFGVATREFTRAEDGYAAAGMQARRLSEERGAREAAHAFVRAREAAQVLGAPALASYEVGLAEELGREADAALAKGEHGRAKDLYSKAEVALQDAIRSAQAKREELAAREEAERARNGVRQAESRTLTWSGRRALRRAARGVEIGERCVESGAYEEARQRFVRAIAEIQRLGGIPTGDPEAVTVRDELPQKNSGRLVLAGATAALTISLLAVWALWRAPSAPSNRPPVLTQWSPADDEISMAVGDSAGFSVEGVDPDSGDAVAVQWLLDGETIAVGPTWRYEPTTGDDGTVRTVTAKAKDPVGAAVVHTWRVSVRGTNRMPRIEAVEPSESRVQIATESEARFKIIVDDPDVGDQIDYAWTVNGKQLEELSNVLTLQKLDEGNHEVKVVATDRAGTAVERIWEVESLAVRPKHSLPPLRLIRRQPADEAIEIESGQNLSFSADVENPNPPETRVVFRWSIDGDQVSDAREWELETQPSDVGSRIVALRVEDGAGRNDLLTWKVALRSPPAREFEVRPAANRLQVRQCEPQVFAVVDPEANSRYEWRVDGQAQPETGPRFSLTSATTGSRMLSVTEVTRGSPGRAKTWEVYVTPAPPSEQDARLWLEDYRRALESKDVSRMRAIGHLATEDDAAEFAQQLESRAEYEVQIRNVIAQVDGDAVRVSFDRIERWKEDSLPSFVSDFSSQTAKLIRQDCDRVIANR